MNSAKERQEKIDSILSGLEKAYAEMAKFKKRMNTPLVVSENGKIIFISADKIPPTASYS